MCGKSASMHSVLPAIEGRTVHVQQAEATVPHEVITRYLQAWISGVIPSYRTSNRETEQGPAHCRSYDRAARFAPAGPAAPLSCAHRSDDTEATQSGNRSQVDGDKHTNSRGAARLLLGCFGRSDRRAQGDRPTLRSIRPTRARAPARVSGGEGQRPPLHTPTA
jgi:hypothetical protein